jgi:hypothetical protein
MQHTAPSISVSEWPVHTNRRTRPDGAQQEMRPGRPVQHTALCTEEILQTEHNR